MKEQENKDVITLETVTAYKTTDGQLYENAIDALEHQKDLNFEEDIIQLAETLFNTDNEVIYFVETITNNRHVLKEIFNKI